MACRRIGLFSFLLFLFINDAHSLCKIPFLAKIISPDYMGPLVYKYTSDGTPEFHYPTIDEDCIFQSEDKQLHLACPGPKSMMLFTQIVGNTTHVVRAASNSVYLLHDSSSNTRVRVHEGPKYFSVTPGNFVNCTELPYPTMINATRGPSVQRFVVGFRLNEVDLLKIYDQVIRDEWVVTHYRIDPAVQSRIDFAYRATWTQGLFYKTQKINITELYSKEYQIAEFQRQFRDLDLTEKYFSGNELYRGQLMFDEETFYYNQIQSTYYYENAAPMWKSILYGNWETIKNVIKKIADNTDRKLDVYVSAFPSYHVKESNSWTLGNTTQSPDIVPVPQILIKAAVDVDNHDRGIVFHTFNDPHLDRVKAEAQIEKYCSSIISDCQELHPEFIDVYKGYTFCCMPADSYVFKYKFDR